MRYWEEPTALAWPFLFLSFRLKMYIILLQSCQSSGVIQISAIFLCVCLCFLSQRYNIEEKDLKVLSISISVLSFLSLQDCVSQCLCIMFPFFSMTTTSFNGPSQFQQTERDLYDRMLRNTFSGVTFSRLLTLICLFIFTLSYWTSHPCQVLSNIKSLCVSLCVCSIQFENHLKIVTVLHKLEQK